MEMCLEWIMWLLGRLLSLYVELFRCLMAMSPLWPSIQRYFHFLESYYNVNISCFIFKHIGIINRFTRIIELSRFKIIEIRNLLEHRIFYFRSVYILLL